MLPPDTLHHRPVAPGFDPSVIFHPQSMIEIFTSWFQLLALLALLAYMSRYAREPLAQEVHDCDHRGFGWSTTYPIYTDYTCCGVEWFPSGFPVVSQKKTVENTVRFTGQPCRPSVVPSLTLRDRPCSFHSAGISFTRNLIKVYSCGFTPSPSARS